MFHTIITAAYVIPNIYVFIRIWRLYINKGYKLLYTSIYLFLASVFPLSSFFSEENTGFISRFLNTAGNYIVPFFLYLFLFVLMVDIYLLINRFFKIISFEKLRRTRVKGITLAILLSLSVVVVIAGIINFNTIRTSEYQIEIPGRSSKIDHLKIAFVADFHLKEETNTLFVKRFVRAVEKIKPDLMIFGGDIVEGDRYEEDMTLIENLLGEINTRYGVFTVLGNHEFYAGHDEGNFFGRSGMNLLCDTIVVIDSSFNLGGRYDSHFRTRKSIEEIMMKANESLPMILIDHRPTEIDNVSKTLVDVQLSGHTHNGQLFPINFITKKVYKLSWGYRKIGNTHFFVTSGIRLWGFPVRTSGKSEIMVIDINFTRP